MPIVLAGLFLATGFYFSAYSCSAAASSALFFIKILCIMLSGKLADLPHSRMRSRSLRSASTIL